MNKVIDTWMKNVKTYPPAEIFFEKYGKEAKAEERVKAVCEELYRFMMPDGQINLLSSLGASYRDLQVLHLMGMEGTKPEYIIRIKDAFLKDAKEVIKALDAMHKKDQILQQYYGNWKVKFQEIQKEVFDMTSVYLKNS